MTLKLYNFNRLIDKYSVEFTLVVASEGHYDGGEYVKGAEVETACKGAIVPISDSKIYQSGGTLTTKDRQLFMRVPINQPLKTVKVRFKGSAYSIEQETNFDDYSDAYIYLLKWVGGLSD